jgi:hypothetical protein
VLLRANGVGSLFQLQVRTRLAYTSRRVRDWGDEQLQREFARARPLVRAATVAYWLGTCYELFRPARAKAFLLWGRPVVTVTVGSAARTIVRVDLVARRAKVVHLPDGLDPADHGVTVDGRLLSCTAGHARRAWRERLRAAVDVVRGSEVDVRSRITLAWAALVVRPDDVHEIGLEVGPDEAAEAFRRCLDTRSVRERTTPLPIAAEPDVAAAVSGR